MRIALQLDGAHPAARDLGALGERLSRPAEPLLQTAAGMMQTFFRAHIQEERGPDGPWPELHPVTRAIRRHYGHGDAPKLVRGGNLLDSLQTLARTDSSVEVGTRLSYAATVQAGGQVAGHHGPTRTVQAFPFVYFTPDEIDGLIDSIVAWYFEEGRDA